MKNGVEVFNIEIRDGVDGVYGVLIQLNIRAESSFEAIGWLMGKLEED